MRLQNAREIEKRKLTAPAGLLLLRHCLMHIGSGQNQIISFNELTNREFLERHAAPGRIGLSGGFTLVDKVICRAQRHLDPAEKWGAWSHAFIFQGPRADGQHWVIESDLQVHRKHIQLGVQENRVSKYYDEKFYSTLAVLDFGLTETQVSGLVRQGLELVASRARYSLRELAGTLLALRRPELRARENLLSRDCSMYCSAFVGHVFRLAGLDLAPGIDFKNTTPEDIARTGIAHTTYLLEREPPRSKLDLLRNKVRRRVRARARQIKSKIRKRQGS